MPPPDPRSRTVSPGFRLAKAVGFPHPSEARTAVSGSSPFWASSYRLPVIGSAPQAVDEAEPQQELPPFEARRAACPYFSFTTSLTLSISSPRWLSANLNDLFGFDRLVPCTA